MKTIQSPTFTDYFGLILLSAIWGSAFIATEMAVKELPVLLITFGRIFLASLFLYFIVHIKKLSFPKDMKSWIFLIFIGILNNSIPFFLITWGQQYINSSTASIMLAVGPFIALILSHYITHDENFTLLKLTGVIIGFFGVFVLLGDDFLNQRHNEFYGEIAMLLATFGFISAGLLLRKMSHLPTLVCSASMFITSSISLLPFVLYLPLKNIEISISSMLPILYLAIIPTAAASLIRIRLVQKVGVQFMSQVSYLIPIFAIIWSWIFFDVLPKQTAWIALFLILFGLFIRKLKK